MKTRNIITIAISLMVWGLLAIPAMATPTHTCITPNADITPEMKVIVYGWGEWGDDQFDDAHFAGLSFGLFDIIEVGGTYRLTKNEDFREDPTFDAKAHYVLMENLTVAAGAYNLGDKDKVGDPIPYGVICYDFGGLRADVGYSGQKDNPAAFAGMDMTAGDATLKMDWTQINDGHDWRAAFGFDVPFELLVEGWKVGSWLTFSSNDFVPDTWIVELSYGYQL